MIFFKYLAPKGLRFCVNVTHSFSFRSFLNCEQIKKQTREQQWHNGAFNTEQKYVSAASLPFLNPTSSLDRLMSLVKMHEKELHVTDADGKG